MADMDMMNEMMGYGGKGSSLPVKTYGELEGGVNWQYQLNMTVSAKVDNLSLKAEKKLVAHMKKSLGYSKCAINKQNNTIYLESITGVNSSDILGYIKHHIDKNAR